MLAVHDVQNGGSTTLTVLAAEDDEGFRTVLETWLSGPGYEIHTVADGEAALDALDDGVDVFLCDRNMPRLSGQEVIERLDETTYDGPVIVLSAYEPDSTLGEETVTRYLTKPISRDELERAINDAT